MRIQISDHFDYKKLIRFTFPTIVMMIFTSLYGVVDGIFVSNVLGSGPFAAVNLIMPVAMIMGSVGFMAGTGGSALVSKQNTCACADSFFTAECVSELSGCGGAA